MPQELLSPEEFLNRLTESFAESSSGTIWLTHKRYTYDDQTEDVKMEQGVEAEGEGKEYDVLVRCTRGDGGKFSARIPSSRLQEFHTRYGSLLKSSLAPHMRKRDKKREKVRSETLLKKKRELYVDVVVGSEGKRGKGRRQRQRKVRAQEKKEKERERVESKEAAADKRI